MEEPPKNKSYNAALKYSGIAFTLAGSILIGVFLGKWLDAKFELDKPYFTLLGTLVFGVVGFISGLKDLLFPPKKTKANDDNRKP